MTQAPVLIAGGGIAGLSTAIALSRAGHSCHIFESRSQFSEVGAGIQLGPNGTRVLRDLGAAERLEPAVGKPQAIDVRCGRTGSTLSQLPLGRWIEERHGAPYWTAHRADLHSALLATAEAQAQIAFSMGFGVDTVEQKPDAVTIADDIGSSHTGACLIGADGVGSTVRQLTIAGIEMRPAGKIAARTVIAAESAPARAFRDNVTLWLAPKVHVVHYPVRGGREIAVVVVSEDRVTPEGWGAAIESDAVLAKVQGLAPALQEFLGNGRDWRQWTLLSAPRLPRWSSGRTVLIGDATGPFFPFLAQGGVMALEDAAQLALLMRGHAGDPAVAFQRFEALRRPRRERMIETAARNGRIYHLDGPLAMARNLTLRTMPATRVMAGYDWLYGHRIAAA